MLVLAARQVPADIPIIFADVPRMRALVAVQMVPEMEAGTYWPADVQLEHRPWVQEAQQA